MRDVWHPLILMSLLLAVLAGCGGDRIVYNQFHDIPDGIWVNDKSYNFTFEVDETGRPYRLLLYLEFSADYAWQNLYTSIETRYPGGDSARTDVVSLELTDKSGVRYGDCSRSGCELTIPLQDPVLFEQQGEYSLRFSQYMRQDSVSGIRRIGLRLVKPDLE